MVLTVKGSLYGATVVAESVSFYQIGNRASNDTTAEVEIGEIP
jgi:hypothetical protein